MFLDSFEFSKNKPTYILSLGCGKGAELSNKFLSKNSYPIKYFGTDIDHSA